MVRYADDFVVVSNDTIEGVRQARRELQSFLESDLRLTMSEEKTRITHVNEGFDFLGFNIQRRKSEGRWVVHLRPASSSMKRIRARIKELTSRSHVLIDEVEQLFRLNAIVRGWCNYYRHISLHSDLEQISRYTWHRYHLWLLKKHHGSRKRQLIEQKTESIHGRQRWTATKSDGSREVVAYQWLPSPRELIRTRYRQKGREGFVPPYLQMSAARQLELPMGGKGPPEAIYRGAVQSGWKASG
jgi:hypothetical protein